MIGSAIAGPYLSIAALALALGLFASAGRALLVSASKDGRPSHVAPALGLGLALAFAAEFVLNATGM